VGLPDADHNDIRADCGNRVDGRARRCPYLAHWFDETGFVFYSFGTVGPPKSPPVTGGEQSNMKFSNRVLVAVALLATANLALAGERLATVTWEGGSASIPTISGFGLVALALLMGVVAARLLHRQKKAVRVMSVLVVAGGVLMASQLAHTTVKLPPAINIDGDACAGGSTQYFGTDPETLTNQCPNRVTITSYDFPGEPPVCFELQDTCPVGTVLVAGGSCTLSYFDTSSCVRD
jgi:hypothetical protein